MKIYRSKISFGLLIFLTLIFIFIGIQLFKLTNNIVGIITIIITYTFIIYTFTSNKYTIKGNVLNVKSGFLINENIDISNIKKIKETNNLISSPAASIDRIELFYNKFDSIIISPKNKADFISELKQINPEIEVFYKK